MITKKEFCDAISELKRNEEFIDKLNDVFREFNSDNAIYSSGLEDAIVRILENIFDDDKNGWISYWIWELNFGETYEEGDVKDENNNNIPLRTAEELYDFLVKSMENNNV